MIDRTSALRHCWERINHLDGFCSILSVSFNAFDGLIWHAPRGPHPVFLGTRNASRAVNDGSETLFATYSIQMSIHQSSAACIYDQGSRSLAEYLLLSFHHQNGQQYGTVSDGNTSLLFGSKETQTCGCHKTSKC